MSLRVLQVGIAYPLLHSVELWRSLTSFLLYFISPTIHIVRNMVWWQHYSTHGTLQALLNCGKLVTLHILQVAALIVDFKPPNLPSMGKEFTYTWHPLKAGGDRNYSSCAVKVVFMCCGGMTSELVGPC
jgi:hypothetical protein